MRKIFRKEYIVVINALYLHSRYVDLSLRTDLQEGLKLGIGITLHAKHLALARARAHCGPLHRISVPLSQMIPRMRIKLPVLFLLQLERFCIQW